MECPKCDGTGEFEYYHDAGDHFSAGPSHRYGWRKKKCDRCNGFGEVPEPKILNKSCGTCRWWESEFKYVSGPCSDIYFAPCYCDSPPETPESFVSVPIGEKSGKHCACWQERD